MKNIKKNIKNLILVAALLAATQFAGAQSKYLIATTTQVVTNGATVTLTNPPAYTLSAAPGGTGTLGIEVTQRMVYDATAGAGTSTNVLSLTLATAMYDPTTGPWYTNSAILFTNGPSLATTVGTNSYTQFSTFSAGAARYVRLVKIASAATNTTTACSAVIRLGQHR